MRDGNVPISKKNVSPVVVPFSSVANNSMFPVEVEVENRLESSFTVTSVLLYDGMTKVSEFGARPGGTAGTGTTLVVPPGESRVLNVWFPMSTTKYDPSAGTRKWKAYVRYAETDIETEIPIEVTVWKPGFAVLTPHAAIAEGAGVWPSDQTINVASGVARFINVWAVNRGYNAASWGGTYNENRSVTVAGGKGGTGQGCSGSGCTSGGACARSCGLAGYGNAGVNGTAYTLPVKNRTWRNEDGYALFTLSPGYASGGIGSSSCNSGGSGGAGSSLTAQEVRIATAGPTGPVATLSAAGGAGGAGASVAAASSSYACNFTCHCTYSVKQPDTSSCGCSYTYKKQTGTVKSNCTVTIWCYHESGGGGDQICHQSKFTVYGKTCATVGNPSGRPCGGCSNCSESGCTTTPIYTTYNESLSSEANAATSSGSCTTRCESRTASISGRQSYSGSYSQSTGSTSSSSKTSGVNAVSTSSACSSWCNSNKPSVPNNAAFTGSVSVSSYNLTSSTCSCSCGACAGGTGGASGGTSEIPSGTALPSGTNIVSGSNSGSAYIALN